MGSVVDRRRHPRLRRSRWSVCRTTVEPGRRLRFHWLRVVVLSAWLHYLLGTTLSQIIDGSSPPAVWSHVRLHPPQSQALDSAVLQPTRPAGESTARVVVHDHRSYYMIDRSRGSPALKRFFKKEFAGVRHRLLGGLQRGGLRPETEVPAACVTSSGPLTLPFPRHSDSLRRGNRPVRLRRCWLRPRRVILRAKSASSGKETRRASGRAFERSRPRAERPGAWDLEATRSEYGSRYLRTSSRVMARC